MKKYTAILGQIVIVLVGIGVVALMLWEPQTEGRNVGATLFEIYFRDPFLAYAYIASIPFFVGLYHVFKVLGYAGQNKLVSSPAIKALQTIKYCALITAGGIVAADAYIIIFNSRKDDSAGAVALGILATLLAIIIAIVVAMLGKNLQKREKVSGTF